MRACTKKGLKVSLVSFPVFIEDESTRSSILNHMLSEEHMIGL